MKWANEIVFKEYVNIGMAVDTEAGLIVPVIRRRGKKDLAQISRVGTNSPKKARDRKVSGEELKGGSFTISIRAASRAHFTPIVKKPRLRFSDLGKGALKAVVRDGRLKRERCCADGLSSAPSPRH